MNELKKAFEAHGKQMELITNSIGERVDGVMCERGNVCKRAVSAEYEHDCGEGDKIVTHAEWLEKREMIDEQNKRLEDEKKY